MAVLVGVTDTSGQDRHMVEASGATISYRLVGAGEPLLLLHGFGETGATWDPLVPALAAAYQVIIPDLRGHGQSQTSDSVFTHRKAAHDILALLEALDVPRVRALGFSSGGMTLLHLGTVAPDRLAAMVVIGAAPYLPEAAREIMRGLVPDEMPMGALEEMGLVHGDTAQARRLLRQFVGLQSSYTDVNFTPPLLGTIRARTLVIHGDRDPFFPVSAALALYEAIPGAHVMLLAGHGHAPFPVDGVGRAYFVDRVLALLAGSGGLRTKRLRLTIACSGQVFGAALICAGQGLMFEVRSRVGGSRGVTCR